MSPTILFFLSLVCTGFAYETYEPKYDYLALNTTVRSESYYIESTIETPTEIYQKKVPLNITGTATIIDNNSFKLDIDIGSLNATNFSVSGYGWHLGYEDYEHYCIEETPFVYNNGSGIYTFSDCDFYHENRFELYANIPVIGKEKIASMFFYCTTGNCVYQWQQDFPGVPTPTVPVNPTPSQSSSPSPTAPVEIPSDVSKVHLNGGQIIGIAVGVTAVVILII